MGRGIRITIGVVLTFGAVGLGVWTWFLAGKTLEVADQWSSVLSSFLALVSLIVGVIALLSGIKSSDGAGGRSFRARDASGARVTLGDNSPIND